MFTCQTVRLCNINMVCYITGKMVTRDKMMVSVSAEAPILYTSDGRYSSFLLNWYKLKKNEIVMRNV